MKSDTATVYYQIWVEQNLPSSLPTWNGVVARVTVK